MAKREHRQAARRTQRKLRATGVAIGWIFAGSLIGMLLWSFVPLSRHRTYVGAVATFTICGHALLVIRDP